MKGQMINDRYKIIKMIGEGGMANVFLAYDTILERNVAVKVLRGDLADDAKFVRRFQREAMSASSLTHPNVVEMYDVGEDDGNYYIIMEYVNGKTLKHLTKRRGALSIPEVRDIMMQLTSGIKAAHDSYIIHRDVKPQNVLILDDGTVKITDFGIAMALNNNELTQTNSVMGSVHYLPPEQANGSGSTIKSDIYSLGILMYELLTGHIPFKGDTAVEIAIKQLKDPIPSVIHEKPDVPQSVENIILKACAKNPKNRYDNVTEMYNDLNHCLDVERLTDERYEYVFPERELDKTKIMPNLKEELVANNESIMEEEDLYEGEKKLNVVIVVLISLIAIAMIGIAIAFFVLPTFKKAPDVLIPDISNNWVETAEFKLKDLGLVINAKVVEEFSDTVPEGKVIETRPKMGSSVKKGSEITIVVSKGETGVVLEDYTGENAMLIQGKLEASGITVVVEEKEINDAEIKGNTIIGQSPSKGEKVKKGETVILYIPMKASKYPNFVTESWTVDAIKEFAEKNGIFLSVREKETNETSPGTILSQSRAAGDPIVSGANLMIEVSKKKEVEEKPETDNTETGGNNAG